MDGVAGSLERVGHRDVGDIGACADARGVVRSEDITANNSIYSYNIADATIKYVSKGAVSDAQKKGWFTRICEKITPF